MSKEEEGFAIIVYTIHETGLSKWVALAKLLILPCSCCHKQKKVQSERANLDYCVQQSGQTRIWGLDEQRGSFILNADGLMAHRHIGPSRRGNARPDRASKKCVGRKGHPGHALSCIVQQVSKASIFTPRRILTFYPVT